jgi:hypothetical protein
VPARRSRSVECFWNFLTLITNTLGAQRVLWPFKTAIAVRAIAVQVAGVTNRVTKAFPKQADLVSCMMLQIGACSWPYTLTEHTAIQQQEPPRAAAEEVRTPTADRARRDAGPPAASRAWACSRPDCYQLHSDPAGSSGGRPFAQAPDVEDCGEHMSCSCCSPTGCLRCTLSAPATEGPAAAGLGASEWTDRCCLCRFVVEHP